MKRTVKTFVVERKRRAAGSGEGPPSIWSKADGDAFREVAKVDRPKDAPARLVVPRPVGHASAEPRILAARAVKPSSDAVAAPIETPKRAKRAAARRIGPEGEIGGRTVKPINKPATPPAAISEPANTTQAMTAVPQPHATDEPAMARRAKRAAARKRLPLHERWKWDL